MHHHHCHPSCVGVIVNTTTDDMALAVLKLKKWNPIRAFMQEDLIVWSEEMVVIWLEAD